MANDRALYSVELTGNNFSQNTQNLKYVRVVDVVLDENHPDYESYGRALSLGGIRYVELSTNTRDLDPKQLPFAWMGSTGVRNYPLVDEIVELKVEPSETLDRSDLNKKVYYNRIVNIWNASNHNGFPNVFQGRFESRLGTGVEERDDVSNLLPFPGDLILEGRLGQSIRLGGYRSTKNILTDESNNGKPFLIISNGRADYSISGSLEDINKDSSSIYLLDNHSVNLIPANQSRLSYTESPEEPRLYSGSQVLLNSNRIFINAKSDSVLVSAQKSFGANGSTVNLDASNEAIIESPLIKLGKDANENIVLGNKTVELLTDLIGTLKSLTRKLRTLSPVPEIAISELVAEGTSALQSLESIETELLPTILSEKVFSE